MTSPSPTSNILEWPLRLEAVARSVSVDARTLVDVGYDHGHLIARLIKARGTLTVIGVERQAICASRFSVRHAHLSSDERARITLRNGDGLGPLTPGEADTLVLAGLGERTMVDILTAHPETAASFAQVILCPANTKAIIRDAMFAHGWTLRREIIARERGRFYPVLTYAREEGLSPSPPHPLISLAHRRDAPERSSVYISWLCRQLASALAAAEYTAPGANPFLDRIRDLPALADEITNGHATLD